jgi:hypothetical protein
MNQLPQSLYRLVMDLPPMETCEACGSLAHGRCNNNKQEGQRVDSEHGGAHVSQAVPVSRMQSIGRWSEAILQRQTSGVGLEESPYKGHAGDLSALRRESQKEARKAASQQMMDLRS